VRMGLFWPVVKEFCSCVLGRHSFKSIYPVIGKVVVPMLRSRYHLAMLECYGKCHRQISAGEIKQAKSNIIWFCWLQGKESFPPIVRACYHAIVRNLGEKEVRVIDGLNYRDYIGLPLHIERKWQAGRIPPAMFSDIIRLELLIKYGGTWIDSTVLVTNQIPEEYLNANLFMPQYTKQGGADSLDISNWFISASSNNEVLLVIRDLIAAYWRDYDCVVWYYVFHLFFKMASKQFPESLSDMPYAYSPDSLCLLHHWAESFNEEKWHRVSQCVPFHKLSCRPSKEVVEDQGNYYNAILNEYS